MQKRFALLVLVALLGFMLVPSVTLASDAPDDGAPRESHARSLYTSGREHFRAHRFSEARDDLERAAASEHAPATLFFLALSNERLRRFEPARKLFEQLLNVSSGAPWRNAVRQRLAELNKPRSKLRVAAPVGATVTVDDVAAARSDMLELLPGSHVVRVEIDGTTLSRKIDLSPGGTHTTSFGAEAEPSPGPIVAPVPTAAMPSRPVLRPVRVVARPTIDGRLDDAAWIEAAYTATFVQKYPDEGRSPSEPTQLRIAYDDSALYVAFTCTQKHGPVLEQLTRRDEGYLSDYVEIDIDTAGDGQSAYLFGVNASGVLADAHRADGIDAAFEWDERWEGAASINDSGFTVEMRIPFRAIPFPDRAVQSWGFQARRNVAYSGEVDEWAFIPQAVAAEATAYGRLEGLLARPSASVEASPYVLGGVRRIDASPENVAAGLYPAWSAGLDARWRPLPGVSLNLTINPDFSEVRADAYVLNLTNTETYRVERRPFFVEGLSLFSEEAGKDEDPDALRAQLLYTRRIGARAALPPLRSLGSRREVFDDTPRNAVILGATKAVVSTDSGLSYGAVAAVVDRSRMETVFDGARSRRLASPLTSYNLMRVAWKGPSLSVGATVGGTTRFEPSDESIPTVAARDGAPRRLCPDSVEVAAGQRCYANAYVASADAALQLDERRYQLRLQPMGSVLTAGQPRTFRDGHSASQGDAGYGFRGSFAKNGGNNFRFGLDYSHASPALELNDLGYLSRQNVHHSHATVGYRTLDGTSIVRETRTAVSARVVANTESLPLQRSVGISESITSAGEHVGVLSLQYLLPRFDDREVGDGTALQRRGRARLEALIATNPRNVVSVSFAGAQEILAGATFIDLTIGGVVRPLSYLVFELTSTASFSEGEQRLRGAGPNGEVLFGALSVKNGSVAVRVELTFSPRLALEVYGQAFATGGGFSNLSDYNGPTGRGERVFLTDLRPVAPTVTSSSFSDGGLNAVGLLQWEYLPGSFASLVVSRAQAAATGALSPSSSNIDLRTALAGPAVDSVLLKLSYWIR